MSKDWFVNYWFVNFAPLFRVAEVKSESDSDAWRDSDGADPPLMGQSAGN